MRKVRVNALLHCSCMLLQVGKCTRLLHRGVNEWGRLWWHSVGHGRLLLQLWWLLLQLLLQLWQLLLLWRRCLLGQLRH